MTPDEGGGTRHYELLSGLESHNVTATVIRPSTSFMGRTPNPSGRRASAASNIAICKIPFEKPASQGFIRRAFGYFSFAIRAYRAALKEPNVDIIWGTSPPLPQAWMAARAAKKRKLPLLIEIRDLWPAFAVEMGVLTNPFLIWIARRMELSVYRSADRLIVNSPAYIEHLVQRGVPEGRITLIPNGVDCEAFTPDKNRQATRAELQFQDEVVFLYAGAHGPANDLDVILDAAKLLMDEKHVRIVLAGDGTEKARLQERAERERLMNVTFLDPLPKDRVPDLLAASDVCLATLAPVPGFTKTYPNKVFDYMAAGKPTLLAIDGVIREVIEAANGGYFVPPGDPTALAAAIRMYAQDGNLRSMQGHLARSYVVQHFDRATHVAQLHKCLDNMVRTGRVALHST